MARFGTQGEHLAFLGKLAGGVLRGQGWSRKPPVMRGCISAAALVAAVDGPVSLAKRNRLDQILQELSGTETFDLGRAAEDFRRELDRIRADGRAGRAASLSNIRKLAGDAAAAALMLRVAESIAVADGAISDHAKSMIAEIADALALSSPSLPKTHSSLPQPISGARVIAIGNEKGGTGKSTAAIHIATGLAMRGKAVACLDLDGRQATLSRFMQYRNAASESAPQRMAVPHYRRIEPSAAESRGAAEAEERERFEEALGDLGSCDIIVVDTPGHRSHLARLAHACASMVITPINDSFIDIDALADIDRERREVRAPSTYCQMVWQERERRRVSGNQNLDWIVTRNRVGQLDSRNTREMTSLLEALSHRIGFRIEPGFSERVVFRELYYRGLTLFDLAETQVAPRGRASLRRARSEVEGFLQAVTALEDRSTRAQRG